MITNNELAVTTLSATKKDYYQIWNELLDLASKISERWDPRSTNESDPGIVLLKVLTALGDKLNYNIDANILEAFMPSAAQSESMRNLCEMMGYNIKYYQSATTDISFAFTGDSAALVDDPEKDWTLEIPIFTTITNSEKDITYITVEDKVISKALPSQTIKCIEGQIVRCENNTNKVITVNQLDDNNRFYLPETQVAENGIFIYRISDGIKSARWEKVNNLNTQSFNSLVYKFGYDSKENRPYLQFPDDIGQIIEDGLEIYYVRTSGVNGNISPRTLSTFDKPSGELWDKLSTDDFNITNSSAAANGANIETINQAYNNYKKTIGTFDTLVTCRDYMNAIYNLMTSSDLPAVSNIIVSDIRDDLNRAITLCSFDNYGISYTDKSSKITKTTKVYDKFNPSSYVTTDITSDAISSFDLMLYPFKKVYGLNTKKEYEESFKLDTSSATQKLIETGLAKTKNIAHTFRYPDKKDIVCIKNYVRLDAKISTTKKVNEIEEAMILTAIKTSLYNKFNARQLDFGEEIPFDSILECIENADARIKNVSLNEPTLYTKFEFADGSTCDQASYIGKDIGNSKIRLDYPARKAYNKAALRNILAGRVELFNYNTTFKYDLNESNYYYTTDQDKQTVAAYSAIYPEVGSANKLIELQPKCTFAVDKPVKVGHNELIKFRAPNFKTKITYPAYVNYFLHLNTANSNNDSKLAIPATFITLKEFMEVEDRWNLIKNEFIYTDFQRLTIADEASFTKAQKTYGALFTIKDTQVSQSTQFVSDETYYYLPINSKTFPIWVNWVVKQTYTIQNATSKNYLGIYWKHDYDLTKPIGYLVDQLHNKYQLCSKWHNVSDTAALEYYFIQKTNSEDRQSQIDSEGKIEYGYTANGLGKNAEYVSIPKGAEYQLKPGEYLAINYTPSAPEDQNNIPVQPKNELYTGEKGDIIKPNFELYDSESIHETKRYQKTTAGYTFEKQVPGMYSLGAQEQIEIRDFVKVALTDNITYLYWTLNNEQQAIDRVNETGSYILEDGEYVYYTDINKTSMAYYGSGTELKFFNGANFKVLDSSKKISTEDIAEKGLDIIPWVAYSFGANKDTDKQIEICEYQYITLAEDDTLEQIDIQGGSADQKISNVWTNVTSANYTLAGVSTVLPALAVDNFTWQVASKLILDISPTKAQILSANDAFDLIFDNKTKITIKPRLNEQNQVVNLAVKANYAQYSTSDRVDVRTITLDDNNNQIYTNDFAVKLYEVKDLGIKKQTTLNTNAVQLHNYNKLWTSVSFANMQLPEEYIPLYINIPQNHFGLLMINYSNYANNPDQKENAYIKVKQLDNPEEASNLDLKIFNYKHISGRNETWWKEYPVSTEPEKKQFTLRRGINVIKIEQSCILRLYPDASLSEAVIFSDLDIIPINNPINLKLLGYLAPTFETYKKTTEQTPEANTVYVATDKAHKVFTRKENIKSFEGGTEVLDWYKLDKRETETDAATILLKKIVEADPDYQFYYNCPLDNSSAIDLNPKLLGTAYEEKLSDVHVWYDKNNINNKFVISEIDADYLDRGIQIARTSKR